MKPDNFVEDINVVQPYNWENPTVNPNIKTFQNYTWAQIPSHMPTQDRLSVKKYKYNGKIFEFYGVYDGHGGYQFSHLVKDFLPYYIMQEIKDAPEEEYEKLIKKAFLALDDELVEYEKSFFKNTSYGTCAVQAVKVGENLYIAHCGDCRAYIFTPEAVIKTVDHDFSNKSEVERVISEHDGEDCIVWNRVLGMFEPFRALGDAMVKLPKKYAENFYKDSDFTSYWPKYKTPPYLTSEPEVSHYKVQQRGSLILTTDGLLKKHCNLDKNIMQGGLINLNDSSFREVASELSKLFMDEYKRSFYSRDDMCVLAVFFDQPIGEAVEFEYYGDFREIMEVDYPNENASSDEDEETLALR